MLIFPQKILIEIGKMRGKSCQFLVELAIFSHIMVFRSQNNPCNGHDWGTLEAKFYAFFGNKTLDFQHCLIIEGPPPTGPKEIDGLLVPPGNAYILLIDHLARKSGFKNHSYI